VTWVTSLRGSFLSALQGKKTRYRRYRSAMITVLAFVAVIALLAAALGAPYSQTWYGRWNSPR
jgi:hypothetical protein